MRIIFWAEMSPSIFSQQDRERCGGVDMAHIQIDHLTFTYPHSSKPALDDVSLDLKPGSLLMLGGKSGSGKSTLLSHLTSATAPAGQLSGSILVDGVPLEDMTTFSQMSNIALVPQHSDLRGVTGKVIDELASGLVRINCEQSTMRSRIAEATAYFGIESWLDRNVEELSDGQRRLVSLASAMVVSPRVLILDDPISQLDPTSVANFLSILYDLYKELKVTVIMSTSVFGEIYAVADEIVVLDAGKIAYEGTPSDIACSLYRGNDQFVYALPSSIRIYHGVHPQSSPDALPLTVGAAHNWMKAELETKGAIARHLPDKRMGGYSEQPVIKFENVSFCYGGEHEVLKDVSLSVTKGSVHAIVGTNGAGKSTMLRMVAGLVPCDRGTVTIHDSRRGRWAKANQSTYEVALLPQNLDGFFTRETVRAELESMVADRHFSQDEIERYVEDFSKTIGIFSYLDVNPRSLSLGERQLAAIAKVMMQETPILLLDEPTEGIDPFAQRKVGKLLHELAKRGVAILIASQDLRFCAEYATGVSLLSAGDVATTETPQAFFSSNVLYTTQASRISRGVYSNCVTDDEVIVLCLENGWQKS